MGITTAIKTVKEAYSILGFDIEVDASQLKKAYRKLSKKYHPDMPTGDSKKFSLIADAYNCLTDKKIREELELSTQTNTRTTSSNYSQRSQVYKHKVFNRDLFTYRQVEKMDITHSNSVDLILNVKV